MKKPYGPSLYYATDKNIFDALNEHKVDAPTVAQLFQRRNILVSKRTLREELARYFSRLTHDYSDHKAIAARLGVSTRRERLTSVDVQGIGDIDALRAVADQLKAELESSGDVVAIFRNGDNLSMRVQYSEVDYKRNEFNQVQVKDGTIEFEKTAKGYTVRNTQNQYLNDVRETMLAKVEKQGASKLERSIVSLFDIPSAKLRSKFFYEMAATLPEYTRRDVTDVYVFKAKPNGSGADDDHEDTNPETHVERVFLKGNGVSRSEVLNGLLDNEDYYIIKMGWTATELLGAGNVYAIEIGFADPADCSGFSYLLTGVYPLEEGKVSHRKRSPYKEEIARISRVVERQARKVLDELRKEFALAGAK